MRRSVYRLYRRKWQWACGSLLGFVAICLLAGAFQSAIQRSVTGDFLLREGQTQQDDLIVVAQHVELQADSKVEGDALLTVSRSAIVGGVIEGDLVIVGPAATVAFQPTTQIYGNLALCAREVNGLNRATIHGTVIRNCDQSTQQGNRPMSISGIDVPLFMTFLQPNNLFMVLFWSVITAGVAGGMARFAPRQHRQLIEAVLSAPIQTGVAGFLTMGALIFVTIVYAVIGIATFGLIFCLGVPIVTLLWLVTNTALILGWAAVSYPLGVLMVRWMRRDHSTVFAAALGAGTLTLLHGLALYLPFVQALANILLIVGGSVGLGAVLLTRFGIRRYPALISFKR